MRCRRLIDCLGGGGLPAFPALAAAGVKWATSEPYFRAGRSKSLWRLALAAVLVALLFTQLQALANIPLSSARFVDSQGVGGNAFTTATMRAPTGLAATGGGSVALNWTATLDTYASGHRVLRGTQSGGPYTQIAEITPRTTTSYKDNVGVGTYYYVVRAFYNNWASGNSNQASATVALGFDAASSADTGANAATSLTFAHTVSGSNRLLIVGVSIRSASGQTVSSVTYGGTSLTLVGAATSANNARAEIWRLVAPASGANNVVVTMSAAARFVVGAASFTGVHQSTPLGSFFSATGNSATASVNVTGVNQGELVIDAMANRNISASVTSPCSGDGQTQRWVGRTTNGTADDNVAGGGSTEAGPVGGGTVTMSWNIEPGTGCTVGSTNRRWAIGAVAIKPVQ